MSSIYICGTGWGIGSYNYVDEEGNKQGGYGFYKPENPHDFFPDRECCSEKEIAAHKVACEEWDKKQSK